MSERGALGANPARGAGAGDPAKETPEKSVPGVAAGSWEEEKKKTFPFSTPSPPLLPGVPRSAGLATGLATELARPRRAEQRQEARVGLQEAKEGR